jgi:uncharacterized RDD family membrane protein YckC
MIPQLVTMRYRRPNGRWRRLWVPVLPVVLVLSPLLVLAVLGGLVVGRVYGVPPLGALRGAGRLLWALPGARFEIEDGQTALLVRVI